jgi:hypothetical protein
MHLAIIPEDLSTLIHAHPAGDDDHLHSSNDVHTSNLNFVPTVFAHGEEEDDHGDGMEMMMPFTGDSGLPIGAVTFSTIFPTPGRYKLFAQFRPATAGLSQDDYLLATFWLEVKSVSEGQGIVETTTSSRRPAGTWSTLWWVRLIISLFAIVILSFIVRRLLRI